MSHCPPDQQPAESAARSRTVAILVTAYRPNPGLGILPKLLLECLARNGIHALIHIVDDGSGPGYAEILETARENGAVIHRHAGNLGEGAALRTGLNAILLEASHAPVVLTVDASGDYSIQDIAKIAAAGLDEPTALHLGIRPAGSQVGPVRRFAGLLTAQVTRILVGVSLADPQTGLRAIPRHLAEMALRVPLNGYDFEMECLVEFRRACGHALCVRQWPIQAALPDRSRKPHFDLLLDSMRIYFLFLRYCAGSVLTLVVDNLVFMTAFARLGSIGWSMVLGRFVAMFVSFYFNRRAVFKFHGRAGPAFVRFAGLVAGLGMISYFATSFLAISANIAPGLAKLVVESALFFASFALNKTFVFSRPAEDVARPGILDDESTNESHEVDP